MDIKEAIKATGTLINFIKEHPEYEEFENDLYSLLDSLNEDFKNE